MQQWWTSLQDNYKNDGHSLHLRAARSQRAQPIMEGWLEWQERLLLHNGCWQLLKLAYCECQSLSAVYQLLWVQTPTINQKLMIINFIISFTYSTKATIQRIWAEIPSLPLSAPLGLHPFTVESPMCAVECKQIQISTDRFWLMWGDFICTAVCREVFQNYSNWE